MEKVYYEDYSQEIKVLSTWAKNSNSVAGLTELQLFDSEGNQIKIQRTLIYLRNCGSIAHKKVNNQCNNIYHTNDENNMWMFLLPTAPEKAEICVNFKSAHGLGAIRIWNYNVLCKDDNNKFIWQVLSMPKFFVKKGPLDFIYKL